jgi:DNA repair exonuclease SbcCD ATPase subunit
MVRIVQRRGSVGISCNDRCAASLPCGSSVEAPNLPLTGLKHMVRRAALRSYFQYSKEPCAESAHHIHLLAGASMSDDATGAHKAEMDAILSAASESKRQIDELLAAANSVSGQFFEKAKSDLSEIDRLKTEAATAKGGVDVIQSSAAADQAQIMQSKTDAEVLSANVVALSEKLSTEFDSVALKLTALESERSVFQSLVDAMSAQKAAAEAGNAAIETLLGELAQTKERFSNLLSETGTQYDALVRKQEGAQGEVAKIQDDGSKISELRRALLETSGETISVKDEIEKLRGEITEILNELSEQREDAKVTLLALSEQTKKEGEDFQARQVSTFVELYNTLRGQILALLPSAGAAGLAYTFYDAKSRYAPTSFSRKPGAADQSGVWAWVRSRFGYNPASVIAMVSFYTLFLVPLGIVVAGSLQLLLRMENDPHFVLTYQVLIVRFLIVLPLGTMSAFGFASLQLYRRLFEEYNHKQRVMELYLSFNGEIEKSGDTEQKRALLTIMLNAVADKAWQLNPEKIKQEGAKDALSGLEKLTEVIAKIKTAVS